MELWESRGPNAGMGGGDLPRDFQRPVGARLAKVGSRHDVQRASTGRAIGGTGFGGRRGGSLVVVPPLVVPIDVSVLQGRFGLTRIQAEVARSFAAGKSVAEIARERGRSENTMACHVREVDRKLGVRRRVELVSRLAWRRGSTPLFRNQQVSGSSPLAGSRMSPLFASTYWRARQAWPRRRLLA